ncbi:MAG: LCP family protein [Clostridiales Family XIII bacterium]|nr:LCP family protein [Clostridiales Family XIII bacterium]
MQNDSESGFGGIFDPIVTTTIEEDLDVYVGQNTAFSVRYADVHRINILLLGHNQQLTDTIMLASFDYDLKRMDIVSVPRDTYYERPDFPRSDLRKINSVYNTEDYVNNKDPHGAEHIAQAVSDVLCGVPIHYYMIISDEGVAEIVDSMGGVKFDVPFDMNYKDETQGLYIDLKEGLQTLDGAHAVQYLRFRKGENGYINGDLGRIEAQQAFVKAALKQSLSKDFGSVIKTAVDVVETNLKVALAAKIAGETVGMNTDNITTHTLPGESGMYLDASCYFADEPATLEMMRQIYSMDTASGTTGAAISGAAVSE